MPLHCMLVWVISVNVLAFLQEDVNLTLSTSFHDANCLLTSWRFLHASTSDSGGFFNAFFEVVFGDVCLLLCVDKIQKHSQKKSSMLIDFHVRFILKHNHGALPKKIKKT